MPAVLARRDEVIHDLDDSGQLPWLEQRGVALVRGDARFDGERRVRVGDDVLVAAKAVVVATGSGPVMPPIPGLKEARPWGNREATTAKAAPESLVILGGGVVGVELAQAWTSLGTKVVLLEGCTALIVREEPFASEQVAAALREAGVDVRTERGRRLGRPRRRRHGRRSRTARRATGAELLVAVGRKPNDGEPRARDDRARAGQAGRGRLEPALAQARLALRDRRRERPRAAHAHGQVPGRASPPTSILGKRRDASSPTGRSRRA